MNTDQLLNGPSKKQFGRVLLPVFIAVVAVVLVGCGGAGNSMPAPTGASVTRVSITDAPSDRVVSFEVTVGPITLTAAGGSPVTVLSGTRRVEVSHLSGTSEPLVIASVPNGSYNAASIAVSNPEVTFVNSSGALSQLEPAVTETVAINFVPAINVSNTASVLTFDLNAASSLTFDAKGNVAGVSFSGSSFSVIASAVAPQREQEMENGELEDTIGKVTGVNGGTFTITVGQNASSFTFSTDTNTEFKEGASLATIINMIVKVEGTTKPDGTLYAREVEGMESDTGSEIAGLVSSVQGSPATSLSIVAQEGEGAGVTDTVLGSTVSANVAGAGYQVDTGNVDTSGLGSIPSSPSFPFDANTIHAGQRVELQSSSGANGTNVSAANVRLKQQALVGIVSSFNGAAAPTTFTLTLPSDSAFAMRSGSSTVTVFSQPGTDVSHLTQALMNGQTVRVRGLVFFTGSSFNLIARRIDQ